MSEACGAAAPLHEWGWVLCGRACPASAPPAPRCSSSSSSVRGGEEVGGAGVRWVVPLPLPLLPPPLPLLHGSASLAVMHPPTPERTPCSHAGHESIMRDGVTADGVPRAAVTMGATLCVCMRGCGVCPPRVWGGGAVVLVEAQLAGGAHLHAPWGGRWEGWAWACVPRQRAASATGGCSSSNSVGRWVRGGGVRWVVEGLRGVAGGGWCARTRGGVPLSSRLRRAHPPSRAPNACPSQSHPAPA